MSNNPAPESDPRCAAAGLLIPSRSYCDQPYVVLTDDGAWLLCMTTGAGHEGEAGQHVTTMRSLDQGKTWSTPQPVEPAIRPENSYAVMLKTESGRVFIFYTHNTDNIRELKRHDGKGTVSRVDSVGSYVFRFSDDGGKSWSASRYPIPVRAFQCDLENVYGGKVRFFWNVGRPWVCKGAVFVPLIKIGKVGNGFIASSEGVLLRSDDLLTARDPAQATWTTLPDGDIGLRAPEGGGPIAEEQNYRVLGDGRFHVIYRTLSGHVAEAFSNDEGHTWSRPRWMMFADGRRMKHPRAACFGWSCGGGRHLLWFHNHGGRFIGGRPDPVAVGYEDRNPAWACGGVEVDRPGGREIAWGNPEVLVYDDDAMVRMSYPDLIEEDGRFFVTETNKAVARVHELDRTMLDGLWADAERAAAGQRVSTGKLSSSRDGLVLDWTHESGKANATTPAWPTLVTRDWSRADYGTKATRRGFTLQIRLRLDSLDAGQMVLDSRHDNGAGLAVLTGDHGTLQLVMNDGRGEFRWSSDPVLRAGVEHVAAVVVDGGPHIVSWLVDGAFCDGGDWRQFGWGRFGASFMGVPGGGTLHIAPKLRGAVLGLRAWDRAVRFCELNAG